VRILSERRVAGGGAWPGRCSHVGRSDVNVEGRTASQSNLHVNRSIGDSDLALDAEPAVPRVVDARRLVGWGSPGVSDINAPIRVQQARSTLEDIGDGDLLVVPVTRRLEGRGVRLTPHRREQPRRDGRVVGTANEDRRRDATDDRVTGYLCFEPALEGVEVIEDAVVLFARKPAPLSSLGALECDVLVEPHTTNVRRDPA